MLRDTRIGARSRRADVKIRNVPVLDQIPDRAGGFEPLELTQSLDRKDVARVEALLLSALFAALGEFRLVIDCGARTVPKSPSGDFMRDYRVF